MNLYQLTTKGLGDFYVLESNPTSAEKFLLEELLKSDYGSYSKRDVINIRLVDKQLKEFNKGKLNFSSENRLLIRDGKDKILELKEAKKAYKLSVDYYNRGGNDTEHEFSKNSYYNFEPNEMLDIILDMINELPCV